MFDIVEDVVDEVSVELRRGVYCERVSFASASIG